METLIEEDKKFNKNNNTLHLEYIYYHPIEDVWEELKDMAKWKSKQSFFKNFELVKGEHSWDIGSQYKLVYKECVALIYETKILYEDEFSKKIVFECIENYMNGVKFSAEYNLYKNTSQNSTLLTYDIHYFSEVGYVILDLVEFEKKKLFKLNDKYLIKNRKFETEQIESCIVKKNKSYIWNLLINFKNFAKVIPKIADEVILEDEKLNLNTEFILKYHNENMEIPLIVSKYKNDEKLKKWKIAFKVVDLNNKTEKKAFYVPFQEISFEIFDIDSNTCSKSMLVFKHTFKKNKITLENLKQLEYNKIVIMKKIRKYCSIK